MTNSLNNKELVAVGHHLAKALSSDTAIIDIAKILSRLAERLDCTAAALHATQAQRDQLAAENAALKEFIISDCHVAHIEPETFYEEEVTRYVSADGYEPETPATDAFLAEVRAQGVDVAIGHLNKLFGSKDDTGEQIRALEWLAQVLRQEAAN